MGAAIKQVTDLFKLRIGIVISFTALAGVAVTPGTLDGWKIALLGLAVLVSSASAGAFNQYVERDIDVRMARTRKRPFVTGTLQHGPFWLCVILTMLVGSVSVAAVALNVTSALFVFLGAFFYAVVYTVWLKRRTWMNIVIGGLAGSFAVLAGAAAVNPELSSQALVLATILFLWTPPHFWSLAIAYHKDYDAAKVPMLPVVVGDERAAKIIFSSTVLLVATSLTPIFFGMGWVYFAGAAIGGAYFLAKSAKLALAPSRATAMSCFHASLMQLTLLLTSAMLDASL
ncbi:MAG: protoheme IX farnesyltransferase [Gallionellaceae bacterium]|nr:MAG: protoheme IX farnesyltransferase [Gallionellaceae bacterium]